MVNNKNKVSKQVYHHFFRTFDYFATYYRQFERLNNSLGMLSQLSDKSQRVLKSYLVEKLNAQIVLKANSPERLQSLISGAEEVFSGETERELKALKQARKQHKHSLEKSNLR